jgi:hypothetical protein
VGVHSDGDGVRSDGDGVSCIQECTVGCL